MSEGAIWAAATVVFSDERARAMVFSDSTTRLPFNRRALDPTTELQRGSLV